MPKRTNSAPNGQPSTPAQIWRTSLEAAYQAACTKLPAPLVAQALTLITTGKVEQASPDQRAKLRMPDGPAQVVRVNTCPIHDGEDWCPEKIAAALLHRTWDLVAQAETPSEPPVPPNGHAPVPAAPADPYTVLLHGKSYRTVAGLLHDATELLAGISVEVVHVSPELAVMRATVKLKDGSIWSDVADATPSNVTKQIAPAFIRMASTRAVGRALRLALGADVVAEELAD
jgi:hypothetical protein